MTINIRATGMELTDAIKAYADEKFENLTRYFNNIQKIDVDLGLRSQHHKQGKMYYAEVNVHVPGTLVRMEEEAADLYKAMDIVKDRLKLNLNDLQEKMSDKHRESIRAQKEYIPE